MVTRSFVLYAIAVDHELSEEEFAHCIADGNCETFPFNVPSETPLDWTPNGEHSLLNVIVAGILAHNDWCLSEVKTRLVELNVQRNPIKSVHDWLHVYQ